MPCLDGEWKMRHYGSAIWCVSGAMRMELNGSGIVGMQASVL